MKSQTPKLYIEDVKHIFPRIYLPDDVYVQALDAMILVCTDIGIIDRRDRAVFLIRRKARPADGWLWFLGGRSYPGESETSAAHRCILRETGLSITKERFEFVSMNRYFFPDREQFPQDRGTDSLCYTFALELSQDERSKMVIDAKEYSGGLVRYTVQEIIGNPEKFPEHIVDFCKDVFGE